MDTTWFFLLVAAGALFYAFRMRRQLHSYKLKLNQLKEHQHLLEPDLADGDRLDALLVSMNEVVFRLDASGRVVGANAQAEEMFSMRSTAYPIPLRQVYRESDWHDAFQKSLDALPEHHCLPDMKLSHVALAPRIAVLNAGHMLLLCVDVTEQRRLEKQRRTFLSNLMHDLKTPLTSLLGYARSMDRFGDDVDFRKEAAHVIADEAKHVNHLLDALLTLDQIEFSGRDASASCQSRPVLQLVSDMLAPQCVEKHVEILCEYGPEPELAMMDDELERIITNLLSNAVNYSPEGGRVRLALSVTEQRCTIVIEDQGEGIPEKNLSRVTERFYRVDKARTRKNGGHGLGLAIVKELAEKNAGTLTLSNRFDQSGGASRGLQAKLVLPLAEATAAS
ncbi:MAG: ATP-binding protein [Mariprofundus sp.]|nr:ATP-binding protein [Mariprofundus sp.]